MHKFILAGTVVSQSACIQDHIQNGATFPGVV